MLLSGLLLAASCLTITVASPLAKRQACIDLDKNGVCDYCEQVSANVYICSEKNGWTTVRTTLTTAKTTTATTTSAKTTTTTAKTTTTTAKITTTTAKITTMSSSTITATTTTMPCVNGSTYTVTPTAAPTALRRYLMNCGYDYTGGDMGLTYAATFEDCIKQCDASKGCLDSSWLSNGFCYLKNVTMPMVTAAGVQVARLSISTTTTISTTTWTTKSIAPTTTPLLSTTSSSRSGSSTPVSSTASSTTSSISRTSSTTSTTTRSSSLSTTISVTTTTTPSRISISSSSTTTSSSSTATTQSSTSPSTSISTSSSSTSRSASTSSSAVSSSSSISSIASTTSASTTSSPSSSSSSTTPSITSTSTTFSSVSSTSTPTSTFPSTTTISSSSSSATTTSSSGAISSTTTGSFLSSPTAMSSTSTSIGTSTSSTTTISSSTSISSSSTTTFSTTTSPSMSSSTTTTSVSISISMSSSSNTLISGSSSTSTTISLSTSASALSSGSSTTTSSASSSTTTFISSTSTSTTIGSTTSSPPGVTPGVLPAAANWQALKGIAWNVTKQGTLGFNGALASMSLTGDKCRTGRVGGQVIWNCGDIMCNDSWTNCGFSMGPGFYGTGSVMTVNSGSLTNIGNNIFMPAWSGDPQISGNQSAYGMDMSNVVGINSTHGVVFAWEILRGASDGSYTDLGNAVASVTLGSQFPIATRRGPLLTGPSAIQLGLLAALADNGYIYLYSMPASTNIITVTRVPASDAVFDASQYQTMNSNGQWLQGIPTSAQAAASYAMTTAQPGGFGCAVYGSVFYNAYLRKYTIICNVIMSWTNMYVSDTPWGPWSAEYGLLGPVYGYGSMAHPEFSPDGGKTIPWSQGPDDQMDVYAITFT